MKNKLSIVFSSLLLLGTSLPAAAVDWPTLQGLEGVKKETDMKIWGFIQPEYSRTSGTPLKAGPWSGQTAAFNRIAPNDSTDTFSIRRARLGVRGQINYNKINYFLLAEFGDNGITAIDGPTLTDASVTLNYIEGASIRIGQFKVAQSNEAQKAIHTFDWNNFTNATNQLLLERFTDEDGSRPNFKNDLNGPVGAFRDIGVQVFNTFTNDDREFTYAVMLGNGNGIARGDNDDNKDLHLFLSTEQVYGGRGAGRQGLKFYAWYHGAKRTLNYANGVEGIQEFDRTRYGVGSTYRLGKLRGAVEYVKADGMIFNGTDGGALPGAVNNAGTNVASINYLTDNKADGWQVDVGYKIMPKIELGIRYDVLNRATDGATPNLERKFSTLGLSFQYRFFKATRMILNYEFRDAEAPNLAAIAGPNVILDGMDDRLSLQVLALF